MRQEISCAMGWGVHSKEKARIRMHATAAAGAPERVVPRAGWGRSLAGIGSVRECPLSGC